MIIRSSIYIKGILFKFYFLGNLKGFKEIETIHGSFIKNLVTLSWKLSLKYMKNFMNNLKCRFIPSFRDFHDTYVSIDHLIIHENFWFIFETFS